MSIDFGLCSNSTIALNLVRDSAIKANALRDHHGKYEPELEECLQKLTETCSQLTSKQNELEKELRQVEHALNKARIEVKVLSMLRKHGVEQATYEANKITKLNRAVLEWATEKGLYA